MHIFQRELRYFHKTEHRGNRDVDRPPRNISKKYICFAFLRSMEKWAPDGPKWGQEDFSLLIQTLPTFWATRILILRINIFCFFWVPNFWLGPGLGPGLGLGLGPAWARAWGDCQGEWYLLSAPSGVFWGILCCLIFRFCCVKLVLKASPNWVSF